MARSLNGLAVGIAAMLCCSALLQAMCPGTFQAAFVQVSGAPPSEFRLHLGPPLTGKQSSAPGKAPRPVALPLFAMAAVAARVLGARVQRKASGGRAVSGSGIRVRKPMNNALRNCSVATYEECTGDARYKPLIHKFKQALGQPKGKPIQMPAGVRRQSGKKYGYQGKDYRVIDFARNKRDVFGTIETIEYDPFRSARICLVHYEDGEKRYILYASGFFVGQQVIATEDAPIFVGNALPLDKIPVGTMIHNIAFYPGKRGAIARKPGTSAIVLSRDDKFVTLKMPSGEVRMMRNDIWATVGKVGFAEHQLIKRGKASEMRALGRRPHVRGKAMNAGFHPHGGGEGKSFIGYKFRRSPYGKCIFAKTRRRNSRASEPLILIRRKRKNGR